MSSEKSICFILNPVAGKSDTSWLKNHISRRFNDDGFDIRIFSTTKKGEAGLLSRRAVEENTNIIVAAGGDGTINEVASEMIGSQSVLGIIPTGSGNGLARHLGIPLHVDKALQLIKTGQPMEIDTCRVNNTPFISIAGTGFDALVAKKFAEQSERGFISYFKIIAKEYLTYEPEQYEIELDDGTRINSKALFVAFANSNQFGYQTTIAPDAKLNDGKIDVCIVKKPKVAELPVIANLLLLRQIDKSPGVHILRTSGITIRRERRNVVNIDGEAVWMDKELHVTIKELSLNVIVHQDAKKTKV